MSQLQKIFYSCFLFLACTLSAQQKSASQNLNARLVHLENTFNQATNPQTLASAGFFIQGDVLFWQARETGLSYAIIASHPLILDILPRDLKIKELDFEWDFGFRVGAGYGVKLDGWDLFAQWTQFVTDAHDMGSISSEKFFLPVWAHPNFNIHPLDHVNETEAHWRLHFNEIDAGIGRGFYISKFFTVRPFIGPSSIWIDQHYHIEYQKPAFIMGSSPYKDRVHLTNAFFGIGALFGCELRFHLTRDLSLLTRGTGAIYAGHFEISRKEDLESPLLDQIFKVKENIHAGRAATALEMGFSWEHAVHRKRYVRVELCYDIHYFFKQNQMPRVISKVLSPSETFLSDQGDLTLHGGSFSITLGF